MIKKVVPLLFFVFLVFGVGFFVVRAIQTSEGDASTQAVQAISSLDTLRSDGLKALEVQYPDGKKFDLATVKAPIVILNFWASWCGPCVEEIPSFIELIKSYNGQVELLAVSLDTDMAQMNQFLKGFEFQNPSIYTLVDPTFEVAQKLGTTKLPESYIFGKDRKLLRKVSGSIDWTTPEIKAYLNSVLTNP